jgi:alpha-tubulin suppressor-like RCC1 family protein
MKLFTIGILFLLVSGCTLFENPNNYNEEWDVRIDMIDAVDMPSDAANDITSDVDADTLPSTLQAPVVELEATTSHIQLTWRGIPGATKYQICKDASPDCLNGTWLDLGLDTIYKDQNANLGTIQTATVKASKGEYRAHVAIGLDNIQVIEPKKHQYVVRAIDTFDRPGLTSDVIEGRLETNMAISFEYSDNGNQWQLLTSTTDITALPNGEQRLYRAQITQHPGQDAYITEYVAGWRLAAIEIAMGLNHICARLNNTKLRCWGSNNSGQLALLNTTPQGESPASVPLKSAKVFGKRMGQSTGANTCAVTPDDKAVCWGANTLAKAGVVNGEQAIGDSTSDVFETVELTTTVTDVQQGELFTCALLTTGQVTCWGSNQYGQLGLNQDTPTLGRNAEDYPLQPNVLASNVKELAVGDEHACVLFNSGDVTCWGRNEFGELGLGHQDNIGLSNKPITGQISISNAKTIDAGYEHTCIITNNDKVQCWGRNEFGQLGIGNNNDIGDGPAEMPPIEVPLQFGAVDVSAGYQHTCAIDLAGRVYCWGNNFNGALGLGNTTGTRNPTFPVLLPGKVVQVEAGFYRTCALVEDGNVYCWGSNSYGGLGLGIPVSTLEALGDETNEPADQPVVLW